jgi:lipopolysaccharide transport system ATP-binding protein
LGKRYVLQHRQLRPGHATFREVLTEGAKRAIGHLGRALRLGNANGFSTDPRRASEEFWALKGVNFKIDQGEVVAVIGRNGAGKSTLLKTLSRITEPTEGRVVIVGRVASLLEVGTGFHPELTGRENIYLNGAILGMSQAEIRKNFDEIVAFAEVEKFLDTPVKRYSSGMYVRLAFAVAAHLEPEILLVDEVLAVGDAPFQKKCLRRMSEVAKGGRTVLFVSHNMSTVSSLCPRTIVLRAGQVSYDGDTEKAIRLYTEDSPAALEPRVNLAERTAERSGPQQYASWRSLELRNGAGNATTTLQMGDQAVFRLGLEVRKPSNDFEIGIVIETLHGVMVHILCSCWEGLKSIPERGVHEVAVEMPVHLFPGEYQVRLWICLQGQSYDDAVHEALRFTVEEGRVNEHPTYFARWARNTQVYIPTKWTVVRKETVPENG